MHGRAAMTALMATLLLSACGSEPTGNTSTPAPSASNAYADRIAALPVGARNAVMFRAITDAEFQCHRVVTTTRQPDVKGSPAWIAQCDDGGRWIVALDATGTAQVTQTSSVEPTKG